MTTYLYYLEISQRFESFRKDPLVVQAIIAAGIDPVRAAEIKRKRT